MHTDSTFILLSGKRNRLRLGQTRRDIYAICIGCRSVPVAGKRYFASWTNPENIYHLHNWLEVYSCPRKMTILRRVDTQRRQKCKIILEALICISQPCSHDDMNLYALPISSGRGFLVDHRDAQLCHRETVQFS